MSVLGAGVHLDEREECVLLPKTKTARNKAYLAWVRRKPCTVCHHPAPSEASHHGPRGMGIKASDFGCIPLCSRCHREWHQSGRFTVDPTSAASRERIASAQSDLLRMWVEQDQSSVADLRDALQELCEAAGELHDVVDCDFAKARGPAMERVERARERAVRVLGDV